MEFDLNFQDDNASFSSSQSLATSEDVDDLRLGAEAYTFSPKSGSGENGATKQTINSFLIMKRGKSLSEEDSFFTVSTITSISDLIDAREGNPEDLLHHLGFTPVESEKSHTSILSRFNANGLTLSSHEQSDQNHEIGYDPRDGIVKAQEWLNRQQSDNEVSQSPNSSKDASVGYKNNNSGLANYARKTPVQKKRSKWSKSRQSSFEHLLPNLKEESAGEVQESENVKSEPKDSKNIRPIRESSKEKEHYYPVECDRRCKDQPDICNDKLLETVTKDKDILHALSDPSLRHLSPSKCANLINMKVDSFELEEVVSNDGSPMPPKAILNASLLDDISSCRIPLAEDQRSWEFNRPSSCTGSIDSSSGFDEGPDEVIKSILSDHRQKSKPEVSTPGDAEDEDQKDIQPNRYIVSTSQAQNSSAAKLEKKLEAFSKQQSTIACTNGIADYVSLNQSKRQYNGEMLASRTSPANVKSPEDHKVQTSPQINGHGLGDRPDMTAQDDDKCKNSLLMKFRPMQELPRRARRCASKDSFDFNKNFNNSTPDISPRKAQSKLYRAHCCYSSMPVLTSSILPNHPTENCESRANDQPKINSSSLMNSIADVAYMSYKRMLSDNNREPLTAAHRDFSSLARNKNENIDEHEVPRR